ncbi:hypothetical protein M9H77_03326 [Catharanthus roseus]|uniref:Uncharacterized protein n=1 Tax=Catharanthus roseus TaxID=4058 RepID=A0ACC0CBC5_CATRO|nr:hypothetical protein M9H77_03326 [Catharanthus roseus]
MADGSYEKGRMCFWGHVKELGRSISRESWNKRLNHFGSWNLDETWSTWRMDTRTVPHDSTVSPKFLTVGRWPLGESGSRPCFKILGKDGDLEIEQQVRRAALEDFLSDFLDLVLTFRLTLLILVETRSLSSKVMNILETTQYDTVTASDSNGFSGGI